MLPRLTSEAISVIERRRGAGTPLMLYLAYPAPHTPWLPSPAFMGKSDVEYVERDVKAVCDEAHRHGARVKVTFENDFMPNDEIKVTLCQICERAGADGVRDLDGLIKVRDLGVSRCGATATAAMLDDHRRREAAEKASLRT